MRSSFGNATVLSRSVKWPKFKRMISGHTLDPVKKPFLDQLFQFFNDVFHTGSRLRILMNTSTNETSKSAICHHGDLLVTPVRIWQFPDANLTKENSETIHIDLETKYTDKKSKKIYRFGGAPWKLLILSFVRMPKYFP